jgi:RimJ/RimL family protein N-acetyltransferase
MTEPAADSPPVSALSTKPTLRGELVVLRLTGSVHAPHEAVSISPDKAASFREWRAGQDDRLDLAVVDAATGACVGEIVFNDWDAGNRACNLRILLIAAGHDRGLGTDALRTFLGYGFEELGLHRVHLEVYTFNPRARRAYEKVGFVAEGTLRDALHYDGTWVDATVMSILAPEWERHHGRPGL